MKTKTLPAAAVAAAIATLGCAGPVSAADPARGRVLYEARCGACHNESVHDDSSHKARNFEAVRARVADFGARIDAKWTPAQIDDVTAYLDERYYRFPPGR
jgi:mono/diheme cytochrome c family protein